MKLFSKAPGPVSPVVVEGRCWDSPDLDGLVDALKKPSAKPDEKVSWVLTHLEAARPHPNWVTMIGQGASDRLIDSLDVLRHRAEHPTGDTLADADVLGLLTETLVQAAWEVRGSGRASTVSKDSFATFHQILGEADEVGRAALDLLPGQPLAGVARLGCGLGLGLPEQEWWSRFEEARLNNPTATAAHGRMLQALCKKWYGDHEMMFGFARKAAAEAPVGDPIGMILATAHVEYLLEEKALNVSTADRELVSTAAERWIAGGPAALAHPYALEAHNLFGWFLRAYPARRDYHLSRTKGRIAFFPWSYLRDGKNVYRGWLAAADKVRS